MYSNGRKNLRGKNVGNCKCSALLSLAPKHKSKDAYIPADTALLIFNLGIA